jgi:hypothetical protein
MKDLRGQARVTTFLRKSLAEGAQDVRKLESMARTEGLLGERQRITHAKAFKRAKHSLRIKSVRTGFGPSAAGVGNCLAIVMEPRQLPRLHVYQFAQSGASQSVGSRGSHALTTIVHQLTSHGTVGISS